LYTDRISVIIELYTGFVGKVSPIYFLTTGWGQKRGPPPAKWAETGVSKNQKKKEQGNREKKSPLQLAFFSCGSWNSRPGFWKRK
jgi:hypothetical protein